jgi:hypothetical protein
MDDKTVVYVVQATWRNTDTYIPILTRDLGYFSNIGAAEYYTRSSPKTQENYDMQRYGWYDRTLSVVPKFKKVALQEFIEKLDK